MVAEPVDRLAAELARHLPAPSVAALASAAAQGPAGLADLRARSGSPLLRAACDQLTALTDTPPQRLAGLLLGAATALAEAARVQSVELVWTGPASEVETSRLTAATVAELIAGAARELLVVSFAAYEQAALSDSLAAAAARGVDITLLLERHADNGAYSGPSDPFADLSCRRWAWPASHRTPGAALHAKIIVVDETVALLGSANLTGRAVTDNLECGVLIRGGPQPKAIRDHLWSLRYRGVLDDVDAAW